MNFQYIIENTREKIRVKTHERMNPNDGLSGRGGVKLDFFIDQDKIGTVSISGTDIKRGFVYDLEVFKKYHGNGYGRYIMEYILKHYDIEGLTVDINNAVAISLYKSLGFKVKKTVDGEKGEKQYWMVKQNDSD